jgi:hypothetical protein
MVTGDETWFHQQTKRQSVEWPHTTSAHKNKFTVTPSLRKVVATVVSDAERSLLFHIMPRFQTTKQDM